ncbi:MAG: sigma-70 family RNA polymerase sigma factor [Gemmatimonadetes bacterium]|nr:sigma-70 family RNA polymerase sigma factor [Gemmatimonadota bacterium]
MGESTRPNFDSFRKLLERFGPLIESVAAQYASDGDDLDDLYQEICIHVWKRLHQFEGRGALGGWIQRLAHRYARNWYNARTGHESLLERYAAETLPIDLAESLTDNPSKLLDYKEFLGGLGRAFASLPERQSDVMILIHLEERSIAEVAEILNSREVTIRSHHRHARQNLRRMLEDGRDDLP